MRTDLKLQRRAQPFTELFETIHTMIMNQHPGIESCTKYGMQFYKLKKNLVYFDVQKGLPIVGVVYAIHMPEIHHLLDFTGRTQIGHFHLSDMTESKYNDLYMVFSTLVEFDLNR